MKYLSLLVLLITTQKVMSQATTNAAANYCIKGMCGQCELKAVTGIRSCSQCAWSIKTLVSAGVYQCSSKDSIEGCQIYFDAENASNSGCHFCKHQWGHAPATTVNGKQHYTCAKIPEKIDNCEHTVKVTGADLICLYCKKEFKVDATLKTCLASPVVANCKYQAQDGTCMSCNKGWVENNKVCQQEGEFKGCDELTATNTCKSCNVHEKFYAVDDTADKGNKCEFNSRLSMFAKILAVVFLVQLTLF